MKLMQSNVHTLPARDDGSQRTYWDSSSPGFGVRATRSSRSYVAQGRVNGRQVRITIAPVHQLPLAQARQRAERILLGMRDGVNPIEEKRARAVEGVTLRDVMQDYIDHKSTAHGPLRALSVKSIKRHVEVSFAEYADKPISAITPEVVLRRFRVLKQGSASQAYQATSIWQSLILWARKSNKALPEEPLAPLAGERLKPKPKQDRIPILRNTLTWCWNSIPGFMDYARRFSFWIEESLYPELPGAEPEYVALYCRERMTASELFELVMRQRKKMELMTLTTERPKLALIRGFMFEPL